MKNRLFSRWLFSMATISIVIFFACSMPEIAQGMGKKDHSKEWKIALGITDADASSAIEPLWDVAQDVIDTTTDVYKSRIKNDDAFPWFSWGQVYGHRLLFHWGFNNDPARHPPLQIQVQKCLDENGPVEYKKALKKGKEGIYFDNFYEYRKKQEQDFWKLIRQLQKERNRRLINAVVEVTGIPTARGYANAIATIIYDIHLLADYSTTNISALPPLSFIEQDLVQYGFKRLLLVRESEKLDAIKNELESAIQEEKYTSPAERAKHLRQITAKFLPEILVARFQDTLSKKGILITIPKTVN